MSIRLAIASLLACLLVPLANAKSKEQVPEDVLKAHTIKIVVFPDVREKVPNPTALQGIRDEVEGAFAKWGRFGLVEGSADLVIVARKGHVEPPKLSIPSDNPRSPLHPNSGNPQPDANTPGLPPDRAGAQRTIDEIRAEADSLEVYRGGVRDPLNAAPVWHYEAKLGLKGPKVAAVEHFRKAIEETEKVRLQKHGH